MNSILRALALLILAAAPSWAAVDTVAGKVSPNPSSPFTASSATITTLNVTSCLRTPADGSTFQAGCGGNVTAGGVTASSVTVGGSGVLINQTSGGSAPVETKNSARSFTMGMNLDGLDGNQWQVRDKTDSVTMMTIAGDTNYTNFPAGNVGVGTASPLTTLDVNGNGVVRGAFDVAGGSATLTSGTDAQGLAVKNTAGRSAIRVQSVANSPAFVQLGDASDNDVASIYCDADATPTCRAYTDRAGGRWSFETAIQTEALLLDENQAAHIRGSLTVVSSVTAPGGILVGSAGNIVGTLASGEYTAVMSTQTNLDLAGGASANSWRYTRVGNQVQVAGQVTLDPTAAANTDTEAFISLPIASNFDASADLSGSCVGFGSTDRAIHIVASPTPDQASLTWRSDTTGAIIYACQFMYEVK